MKAGILFVLAFAASTFPMHAKESIEDRLTEFGAVVDAKTNDEIRLDRREIVTRTSL